MRGAQWFLSRRHTALSSPRYATQNTFELFSQNHGRNTLQSDELKCSSLATRRISGETLVMMKMTMTLSSLWRAQNFCIGPILMVPSRSFHQCACRFDASKEERCSGGEGEESVMSLIRQWNEFRDASIQALSRDSPQEEASHDSGNGSTQEDAVADLHQEALWRWLTLSCGVTWMKKSTAASPSGLHALTSHEMQLLLDHAEDSWWIRVAAQRIALQFESMAVLTKDSIAFSHGAALLFAQTLCALMQSSSFHRVCLEEAHGDTPARRSRSMEEECVFVDEDLLERIHQLEREVAQRSTDSASSLLPYRREESATTPSSCSSSTFYSMNAEKLQRTLCRTAVPAMRESIFEVTHRRLTFHILHSPAPPVLTEKGDAAQSVSEVEGETETGTDVSLRDPPPLTGTERQHEKINYQLSALQSAEEREHALLLLDTVDAILALSPPPLLHPILHSMVLPAVALCHEASVRTTPTLDGMESHALSHSALATLALALARCGQVGTGGVSREEQQQKDEEEKMMGKSTNTDQLVSTVNTFTLINELHMVADVARGRMRQSLEVLSQNAARESNHKEDGQKPFVEKKPLRLHFSLKAKKEYERLQSERSASRGNGLTADASTDETELNEDRVLLMCDLAELCSALSSMHYRDVDSTTSSEGQREAAPRRDLFWSEVSNYFCAYVDYEMSRAIRDSQDFCEYDGSTSSFLDVSFSHADLRSVLFAMDYAGNSEQEYDAMMRVLVKWGIVAEYIPPPSTRAQSMRRSSSPNKS